MTQPHWVEDYFAPPGPAITNDGTGTLDDVPTTEEKRARGRIRFTGAAPTVDGLASGRQGRKLSVYAIGGPLILANENTGSLAANRIVTGTGGDLTISQGAVGNLEYDEEAQRWRVSAGGSSGGGTVTNDGGKVEIGKTGTNHLRTVDFAADTGGKSATQGTDIVGARPLPPGQINAKDAPYGAVGNGSTDDRDALNSAATAAANAKLHLPAGTYKVSSDLTIGSSVHVHFEEGAILSPDSGKTVTIQGRVTCHPRQHIFGGAGAIAITRRAFDVLHAENFGAVGDGSTDDASAIQKMIDACFSVSPPIEVATPSAVYGVSTMLTTPPATPALRWRGSASYQGLGTRLKALAAIDAIITFAHHCVVEGITFDANENAKNAVVCEHATLSKFSDCSFVNATRDGLWIREGDAPIFDNCTAVGNGITFCSSAGVASQYNYIGGNSGHTQTQVVQSSTNDDITLTVDADQHTVTATAAGGTIDFLALGLRYGDVIRFNGGSGGTPDGTSRFFQVCQVLNATTIMIAGNLRLATPGAYTDWAIGRGDGVRSAGKTANNSQHVFRGGVYQFNAGSGIAIPGAGIDETGGSANFVFGMDCSGVDPQYNGAAGILVGQATCNVQPATLVGITFSVTGSSPTVVASADVSALIAPGAFFQFASQSNVTYKVLSVAGANITLTANYTGPNDGATTITSDNIGCAGTNLDFRNHYEENNAAGAYVLSNCQAVEIRTVFGGSFASAIPDILADALDARVAPSAFNGGGLKGVGGFASRAASEEIAIGSFCSSVPNLSLQNFRTGWQQQGYSNPAASDQFDSTRTYQRVNVASDTKMTSTPTVVAPHVSSPPSTNFSQVIYLQNGEDSAAVLTLQSESALGGSGLYLQTPILDLPPGAWVVLMWDYNQSLWKEVGRGAPEVAIASAVDVTIKTYQRRVTVTAGGKTVTLPASPYNGEIHTVKAGGAFTTDIAGNGNNIDGAATATTATRGALTVRWNATTGEWETV